MFSFQNINNAYIACRKNKRNTINQLEFEFNLLDNLWKLKYDLDSNSYHIGKSLCFLTSSPKLREIFASDFRDRVVHHILVGQLEPFYEKRFIYDLYNNRKNRGIHGAVKRAKSFMNATHNGYYLQLDIKGFFYNLDKDILFMKIFNDIKFKGDEAKATVPIGSGALAPQRDEAKATVPNASAVLWLVKKIIYHDPTKNYIFKGDPSKQHQDGLDFLGYIIRPNYILTRQRVVNNYKYKKVKYLQNYERQKGKMSLEEIKKFLSVQASFVSHIKHSNSFNLTKKVGVLDENNPFDYNRSQ